MSGADLFVDGFPHGTTRGYELGCRGSACPAKVEFGQSCREANIRVASDWGYRKLVQWGASVEEQRLPEGGMPTAPVEKPKKPRQGIAAVYAPLGQHKPKADRPKPVPRPMPAPPKPVASELEQWPEESAPQPAGLLAKSQGAFASHPKQRDHALATASERFPMGLTLGGEPRRRCAPGTVLVDGVLRRSDEAPTTAAEAPVPEVVAEEPESTAPTSAPEIAEQPADVHEVSDVEEEPWPRGKRVLDDALRTITEAAELQRALAVITERALRTARVEINHMRREAAALENQQEK